MCGSLFSSDADDRSTGGVTFPDYVATRADSIFDESVLSGLVSPKAEKKELKSEEESSRRGRLRRAKSDHVGGSRGVKRKHSKEEAKCEERRSRPRSHMETQENWPSVNSPRGKRGK